MLVIVGGHSRNIGKTSVVAGVIRAIPEWNWTAIKITQHGHGVCSVAGKPCACAPADRHHACVISEEPEPNRTDTGRFLAAGARWAFWIRTPMGQLGSAMPCVQDILRDSENVIIESNSILEFVQPDLYLVVLDFSKEDFKSSSLRLLDRADAVLVVESGISEPRWRDVPRSLWGGTKRFVVRPPQYVPPDVATFVRSHRTGASSFASCEPSTGGIAKS